MKNKSLIVLGGVAAVLLIVAISLSTTEEHSVEDVISGKLFLSKLQGKENDVAELDVNSGGETATVYRKENSWLVKEKNDYPADFSQVKKLLLTLSELKTIEPKTKKPENYDKLGVQEPGKDTGNKLVVLKDQNQQTISSLIVGKAASNGVYVRRPEDGQAWLVKGRIDLPANITAWLDKTIADINASDVKAFVLNSTSKGKLAASKEKADDANYTVAKLPKGKELKSASAVNSLAGNLRGLKFNDVVSVSSKDLSKAKLAKAEYTLFSGVKIAVAVYKAEDKDFLSLQASATSDEAKQKADEFNARWNGWLYEIPSYKADSLRKKLSEVLKNS